MLLDAVGAQSGTGSVVWRSVSGMGSGILRMASAIVPFGVVKVAGLVLAVVVVGVVVAGLRYLRRGPAR